MKAFRSPLLNRVMADPQSRAQLHRALVQLASGDATTAEQHVSVTTDGRTTVYRPVIVPYPHRPD